MSWSSGRAETQADGLPQLASSPSPSASDMDALTLTDHLPEPWLVVLVCLSLAVVALIALALWMVLRPRRPRHGAGHFITR